MAKLNLHLLCVYRRRPPEQPGSKWSSVNPYHSGQQFKPTFSTYLSSIFCATILDCDFFSICLSELVHWIPWSKYSLCLFNSGSGTDRTDQSIRHRRQTLGRNVQRVLHRVRSLRRRIPQQLPVLWTQTELDWTSCWADSRFVHGTQEEEQKGFKKTRVAIFSSAGQI